MSGVNSELESIPPKGLMTRYGLYRERRRRGAKELGRLRRSDAVLFSPGNSGRTWLRVMLTRVIERCYGLSAPPLLGFDNLKKLDERIPAIVVTHNRWLPYYKKPHRGRECAPYYPHRVLMLVRNPLDTCVSQYFQWQHRSKDANVLLKGWPSRSTGLSLQEFLRHPEMGVKHLCIELDTWLRECKKFEGACILRYEDMLENPAACLGKAASCLALPVTEEILLEAAEYGSFDRMKQREISNGVIDSGAAAAASGGSADSYKARVGKVGGYVDYLTPEEWIYFSELVAATLSPQLGYAGLPEIQRLAT